MSVSEEARQAHRMGKRLLDVIGASLLLILAAPLMALIALVIPLESRGPLLFRQRRVGRHGQPFVCYKFRTMAAGSDDQAHREYMRALIEGSAEKHFDPVAGEHRYALVGDARVTRLGRLLREFHFDEMPQLINVLKGEMSLVGPRPPIPYEVEMYHPWHHARLNALPGITGLWQICGYGQASFDEMVRMDLAYVDHQSTWLDLKILLLTPYVTLFRALVPVDALLPASERQ